MPKAAFDLGQLLVQHYRFLGVELRLTGGDHVFPFQSFLGIQTLGVLEKPKSSIADLPGVVPIALMRTQGAFGRGTDALWLVQLAPATRACTRANLARVRSMACSRLPCS